MIIRSIVVLYIVTEFTRELIYLTIKAILLSLERSTFLKDLVFDYILHLSQTKLRI